eukprot:939293-Pleurochrysis_carterae.AAC.1
MKVLREGKEGGPSGLTGRYETAYGVTEPVNIQKGLGQGDLLSPVRVQGNAIPNLCGRRHHINGLHTHATTSVRSNVGDDKDPRTEYAD